MSQDERKVSGTRKKYIQQCIYQNAQTIPSNVTDVHAGVAINANQ